MAPLTPSKYPNRWQPPPDERRKGLLDIAFSIEDGCDFSGSADQSIGDDGRCIMSPRELVRRMRESADRIEALTESEDDARAQAWKTAKFLARGLGGSGSPTPEDGQV